MAAFDGTLRRALLEAILDAAVASPDEPGATDANRHQIASVSPVTAARALWDVLPPGDRLGPVALAEFAAGVGALNTERGTLWARSLAHALAQKLSSPEELVSQGQVRGRASLVGPRQFRQLTCGACADCPPSMQVRDPRRRLSTLSSWGLPGKGMDMSGAPQPLRPAPLAEPSRSPTACSAARPLLLPVPLCRALAMLPTMTTVAAGSARRHRDQRHPLVASGPRAALAERAQPQAQPARVQFAEPAFPEHEPAPRGGRAGRAPAPEAHLSP